MTHGLSALARGRYDPAMPTNRLAGETSPYLLQHAHNPVDWHPWGAEALELARAEDRPIFLSIGYAACHWCHVMERESFEDPVTAAYLNANFVSIKVDREERPDLDAIYMDAVQALTGSGGWPMSVFLTPDGRPFYGGTYFPNTRRHGLPSFRDVLEAVAGGVARAARRRRARRRPGWPRDSRATVRLGRRRRLPSMPPSWTRRSRPWRPGSMPRTAAGGRRRSSRSRWRSSSCSARAAAGDARALPLARRTLDRMAAGGIHDQLGGGFARYADGAQPGSCPTSRRCSPTTPSSRASTSTRGS